MFNVSLPLSFSFVSKEIIYLNTMYKENDQVITQLFENGNINVLTIKFIFIDENYKKGIFYGTTIEMWYNYKSLLFESTEKHNVYSSCNIENILIPKPVNLLKYQNKFYLSTFESI